MQKNKLAELVLQRMREKKEQEDRNRPHNEVLQMQATFSHELNGVLRNEITNLQLLLKQHNQTLDVLQQHAEELDLTGKKQFPRIIIKPDFYASEHINPKIKEFYRKLSNTFLRTEILRKKNQQIYQVVLKDFDKVNLQVKRFQNLISIQKNEDRRIGRQKRIKVLKQEIRKRQLAAQIQQLRDTIQRQRQDNIDLVKEYQTKKLNLDSRKRRLQNIDQQIAEYKEKIGTTFSPVTYRDHLKKIYTMQAKNEMLMKNIQDITQRVKTLEAYSEKQISLSPAQRLKKFTKTTSLKQRKNGAKTGKHINKRNQLEFTLQFDKYLQKKEEDANKNLKGKGSLTRKSNLDKKQEFTNKSNRDLIKIQTTSFETGQLMTNSRINSVQSAEKKHNYRYKSECSKLN